MDCIYGAYDYKNKEVICSLHGNMFCKWDYEQECPGFESREERAKRIEKQRRSGK